MEVLKQPTDTCEILGRAEQKTIGLLDSSNPSKGIYVQYGGGDKCTNGDNPMLNGKPRQTKFNIYCSEKMDEVNRIKFKIKFILVQSWFAWRNTRNNKMHFGI